jgi:hypothetical protein
MGGLFGLGIGPDVGPSLPGFVGDTIGGITGSSAARDAKIAAYGQGIGAIRGLQEEGARGLEEGLRGGLGAIGRGYGQAGSALGQGYGQGRRDATSAFGQSSEAYGRGQGMLGQGRQDLLGAYGQGQGALFGGLQGGLGQLGAGRAAAQGYLDPQIQSDLAARGAYGQRLMGGLGGADDPYWNRLGAQRTAGIETSLAKQGLLGSSAGAQAVADSGAQLQNQREQQFFERASGLFNAGAGQQAAGLAQQAGMAGADLYGRAGQASAGLYGQQGEGLAGMGRAGAGLFQDQARGLQGQGEFWGNMGARQGEQQAGILTGGADRSAVLFGDYGRGLAGNAGNAMGSIGSMYGGQAQAQGGGWLNDTLSGGLGTIGGFAAGGGFRGR